MKKIFILMFISALLWSCGDDDKEGVVQNASLELSTDVLTFDYNGAGEVASVKVTSSEDWELTGRQDWATPSVGKGKSGESVTFMLQPNRDEVAREVDYIFFCGNTSCKLTIVQNPLSYSENVWDDGKSDFSFNADGGYITRAIKSNVELAYEISNNVDEWIKLGDVASDTPEKWYQFHITPNEGYAERTATITLFKGTDAEEELTINQETRNDILIEKESWDVGLEAGTVTVKIRSNINITVRTDYKSNWLTMTNESDYVDTEIPGLKEKNYTYSFTKAAGSRIATVTVSGSNIYKSFTIRQSNPNPTFVVIPDKTFLNYLLNKEGFIIENGEKYELTDAGHNATEINFSGSVLSLEGIEAFPKLTKLIFSNSAMSELDLSKTKLTTLNLSSLSALTKLVLGDIPVESLTIENAYNRTPDKFSISGTKLKTLSLAYTTQQAVWYDSMKEIDLSGCPALESADCRRNGKKLTAVYISQQQKTRMDNGQLTVTLSDGVDPGIIQVK